jgi:small subunit ribosomal protein S17
MAETTVTTAPATETAAPRRTEKVGLVVSTKMEKTIVVEIEMRKAHPKYKRVLKSNKKFYAHDERWSLEEIIRRSSLSAMPDEKPVVAAK